MTSQDHDQDIKDLNARISATWDTILGLENSIKEMEAEVRALKRA